jgi:hypothetical protein
MESRTECCGWSSWGELAGIGRDGRRIEQPRAHGWLRDGAAVPCDPLVVAPGAHAKRSLEDQPAPDIAQRASDRRSSAA